MKRFIMYLMTYILITFSTAVGVVLISDPTKATNTTVNVGGTTQQTEASSPLTYVVDNFTTMQGMKLDATVDLSVDNKPVKILADVTLDLSGGFTSANAGGTLTVFVNGNPVDLDFSYVNGTLYFSVLNGHYQITTDNLMASIGQILEILNVEMPDLSGLGIDLNNLDITSIMSMFDDIKETKYDTYTTLSVYLPYVANVDIKCDLNYNIKEISLPKTTIDNFSFKFNALASYPSNCKVEAPTHSSIDLTHVFNLAQGLANFVTTNNQIGLNANVLYNNISLNGNLSLDLENKNVGFRTTFDNKNLEVYLINNVVYVEFENILVKADITQIDKLINLFTNELGINLPVKEIAATMVATQQIDLSSFSLDSFNPNTIDLGILQNFTYENGVYTINVKDTCTITFEFDNGEFKNINFEGFNAVAKLESIAPFEIKTNYNEQDYVDIYQTIPAFSALINTLKYSHHTGTIGLTLNNQTFNVNYEIDTNNGLLINLNTSILDMPLALTIKNNNAYVSVSDINIVCNLTEIERLTKVLTEQLKLEQPEIDVEQVKQVVNNVLSGSELLFSVFEETENGLKVEILEKLNVNLTFNETIENIETTINDVKLNVSINSDNNPATISLNESKFVDLNNVITLAENIYDYFKSGNYYFNTTLNAFGFEVNGYVGIENALNTPNLMAEFNANVLNKQINIKMLDNVVYLEIDGFNLMFNLSDYNQVIKFIETNFGVNVANVVNQTTQTLTQIELPTTLSGLNLKLTNNSFEVNYDQAKIAIDIANQNLNNIGLSINDVNLNLAITRKQDITLEHTYINFVKLLPFIESALNTANAGKIQGKLNLILNTEAIALDFKVEYMPKLQVWLQTNYKGLNIKVNLYNNQILLSVNELYLKADINDANKITEFLRTNFNLDLTSLTSNLNLNSFEELNNLSLSVLNNLVVSNNAVQIDLFNTNINVAFNKFINNITIKTNNVYALLTLSKFGKDVYMPVINTSAYDTIDYVLNTTAQIKNAIESNNYTINGNITLNDFDLPINAQVLVGETLKAKINTTLLNKDVEIVLIDNMVYATIDGFKVKYDLNNVDSLIDLIETTFEVEFDDLTKEFENFDVNDILDSLYVRTLKKTNTKNGFNLNICVLVEGEPITLVASFNNQNGLENISATYSGLSANLATTFGQVENISVNENEYETDLHSLTELVKPVKNLIDSKQIELNGMFKFDLLGSNQTLTITNLKLDYSNLENIKAIAQAEFLGFNIVLGFENNTIYVGADNLRTYVEVNEINDLINWINTTFNQTISIPETEVETTDLTGIIDLVKNLTITDFVKSITRTPNGLMVNIPAYYDENGVATTQEIVLSYLNNEFTSIIINHKMVYAEINFVNFGANVGIVGLTETEKATFVKHTELTNLITTLTEFVTSKQYAANAQALVYNGNKLRYDVNLGLKIDVTNELKVDGYANVAGEQNVEFDLDYWNKHLFVNYSGLKLKIAETDIKQLIAVVLNLFGVDPSLIPFIEDAAEDLGNVNFDSISGLMPNMDFNNPLSILNIVSDLSYQNGKFEITIDGSALTENPNAKEMYFSLETQNGNLSKLSLTNLYTGVTKNEHFNLHININEWEDIAGISETEQATYHDLSGSVELVKALINTAELKYYHITATANVNGEVLGFIPITWNIPLDVKIKVEENGMPTVEAVIGEIPTMGMVNKGTFESISKRMFYLYYKDNYLYLNRTETNGGKDYKMQVKLHINDVLADPLYVLQFGTGFTDDIMGAIQDSLNKGIGHTPNPGNVLKNYTVKNSKEFSLTLNMYEITNDELMGDMTVGIGVINNEQTNNKNYVGTATFGLSMPLAPGLFDMDLSSNNLTLTDIGQELNLNGAYNFINNYTFGEGEEYEIVNGTATLASTKQYTISFEENGGSAVSDITAVKDAAITLPTYTDLRFVVDEANGTKTYYKFDGWYTDPDFTSTTKFTKTTMPRGGAKLYAKWDLDHVEYVITLTFNSNGGTSVSSYSNLAGVWVDLSAYKPHKCDTKKTSGLGTKCTHTHYTFEGWYLDSALTKKFNGYMPNQNTTLYAKYTTSTSSHSTGFGICTKDCC